MGKSKRQPPPSMHLRMDGDVGSTIRLLTQGADPKERDEEGNTPLMRAAAQGWALVVRELLPYSDPLAVNAAGDSALWMAARRGQAYCVEILLPASDVGPAAGGRRDLLDGVRDGWGTPADQERMAAAILAERARRERGQIEGSAQPGRASRSPTRV